jgi:hypothetical protein
MRKRPMSRGAVNRSALRVISAAKKRSEGGSRGGTPGGTETACTCMLRRCGAGILTSMTRTQVALRLGKSLATVRRLEGVLLHPRRDSLGVHRFDPGEVEDLAEDVRNGHVSLVGEMRPAAGGLGHLRGCGRCDTLERELAAARTELDQKQALHTRDLAALRNEHQTERARLEANTAALVAGVEELLGVLEA